jgi:hypothetical protein
MNKLDLMSEVPTAADSVYAVMVPRIAELLPSLCPPETTSSAIAKLLVTVCRNASITGSYPYILGVSDDNLRMCKIVDVVTFMAFSPEEAMEELKVAFDDVRGMKGSDPPQQTPPRKKGSPDPNAPSYSSADIATAVNSAVQAAFKSVLPFVSNSFAPAPSVSPISASTDASFAALARHMHPIACSWGPHVCPYLERTGAPSVLNTYGAPMYSWKADDVRAPKLRALLTKMASLLLELNDSPSISFWKRLDEKKIKLPTAEWNLVYFSPSWVAAELVASYLLGDLESYAHLTCARMAELDPSMLDSYASGRVPVPSAPSFGGLLKSNKGGGGGGGGGGGSAATKAKN